MDDEWADRIENKLDQLLAVWPILEILGRLCYRPIEKVTINGIEGERRTCIHLSEVCVVPRRKRNKRRNR